MRFGAMPRRMKQIVQGQHDHERAPRATRAEVAATFPTDLTDEQRRALMQAFDAVFGEDETFENDAENALKEQLECGDITPAEFARLRVAMGLER